MRREAVTPALEDAPSIEPARDNSVLQSVPLSAVSEVRVSNVDKKSAQGQLPVRLCNYTDVYKNDYITNDLEFMRGTASRADIARFGLCVGDAIITKDFETPDDIGIPLARRRSYGRSLMRLSFGDRQAIARQGRPRRFWPSNWLSRGLLNTTVSRPTAPPAMACRWRRSSVPLFGYQSARSKGALDYWRVSSMPRLSGRRH